MVEPHRVRAVLALLFNALAWGVSWWPLRLLESRGLHPLWATACAYGVSLVCVVLARPGAWRHFAAHRQLWLLAIASGLANVCFNWAVTVGDVVRVVLLFYLMPTWSVLLAWWLLDERPTRHSLMRLALALTGVALVLYQPGMALPMPASASDWLGLTGGVFFALVNILLLRLRHTPGAARMLAMFGGGAATAAAVASMGAAAGFVSAPPTLALNWLAPALGLSLVFLAGNLALQYGAARLAAGVTALVMLSEVVFAAASSVLLGAATLQMRTLLGGGLILATALLASRPSAHSRRTVHHGQP